VKKHITCLKLVHSLVCLLIVPTAGICTQDTVKLVKNIKPAVVLIQTFDANNSPLATGSGFFIDNKGSLITNHHVIEGAYSATVKTSQGKEYQVTGILAKDTEADIVKLAVQPTVDIDINGWTVHFAGKPTPEDINEVRQHLPESGTSHSRITVKTNQNKNISDSNTVFLKLSNQIPSEGEDIVVVGNPLGLESSVSTGIVSAVRDIPAFGNTIQITAPISPGSSGSPVVNSKGEVIGIATLIMTKGQNLNFAVPADKIVTLKNTVKPITLKEYLAQTSTADANDAQKLYEEGLRKMWAENWLEALDCFKKATHLNPQYTKAWSNLGVCYGKLGRYQEAIDACKRAIKINPDDAAAHNNLGAMYGNLGRSQEAAEAFKQAIRIKPDDADAHYNLGVVYGDLGRHQEEIDAYTQAIRIKPENADAHNNLGIAYANLGRYGEAIETYKQAIRIKPDHAEAHNNLGFAYKNCGHYQKAMEAFQQAIKIKPNYVMAHYNLGLTYLILKDNGSALAEYKILKTLDAEQANKLFNLIYK
jgi:Flp pilus assembly protein TadD